MSGSGFVPLKPGLTRKQLVAKNFAEQTQKERQVMTLVSQKRLREVESIYLELIAQKSKNHIVYGNLAAILLMQGRHNASVPLLKKAIQIKPSYPDAHNNLGVALRKQGNLNAAISSYKVALRLKPNYPLAHYNLGNAFQEQGNLEAAIATYNNAIKFQPNYAEAHLNSSLTMLLNGDYKNG